MGIVMEERYENFKCLITFFKRPLVHLFSVVLLILILDV